MEAHSLNLSLMPTNQAVYIGNYISFIKFIENLKER